MREYRLSRNQRARVSANARMDSRERPLTILNGDRLDFAGLYRRRRDQPLLEAIIRPCASVK